MSYIFEAAMYIFNGALMAWYFTAFLIPKTKEVKRGLESGHKRFFMPVCFCASYVLLRYIIEYLPAEHLPISILAMLKPIIMAALMFGLSFVFFKRELSKQVFLLVSFCAAMDICSFITVRIVTAASSFSYQMLGEFLVRGTITPEQVTMYMNNLLSLNHVLLFVIYAVFCYFSVKSIAKGFRYKDYAFKPAEMLYMALPCFSMFALSLAMREVFFGISGGEQVMEGISGILFTSSAVFLLLTLIATVRLFQKSIQLRMEEKNAAIIKEQVRYLQNQDTSGIYTELREMRHDMRNHLANIALLVKSTAAGNTDAGNELETYLSKMSETMETLDFAYDTGNSLTNLILEQKYFEAKQKHIEFYSSFAYPTGLGIDSYDLAVILSNALDNAMEACESLPEQERFIRLESCIKGCMFFIETCNSYAGVVEFDDSTSLPVSIKPDSDEHGLGMVIIQRFARKYLGDIDIQLSEKDSIKTFRLTIMLQERA